VLEAVLLLRTDSEGPHMEDADGVLDAGCAALDVGVDQKSLLLFALMPVSWTYGFIKLLSWSI